MALIATPPDRALRDRLQLLADRFCAGLPTILADMAGALAECGAAGTGAAPAPAPLQRLHAALHGLAGSSATFGYAVLGQRSRVLEQQLRAILAGGAGWPEAALGVARLIEAAGRDPGDAALAQAV